MVSKSYQLIVIHKQRLETYDFPSQIAGRFWIHLPKEGGEKLVEVWGKDGQWFVMKNEIVKFPSSFSTQTPLHEGMQFQILFRQEQLMVLVECPHTISYERYVLDRNKTYQIGRVPQCELCIQDAMVSTNHAVLYFQEDRWHIGDEQSKNGTYVNGSRIKDTSLVYGDCIQLLRYRIFMGRDSLLLANEPTCRYQLEKEIPHFDIPVKATKTTLYKAVYPVEILEELEITMEQPPNRVEEQTLPLLLAIGPSFTMGVSSLCVGLFGVMGAIQQSQPLYQIMPTLVMSFSMALSVMVWPLLSKKVEKRKQLTRRLQIQEQYLSYLAQIEHQIQAYTKREKEFLLQQFETTEKACDLLYHAPWHLHHRMPEEESFFQLVIGIGTLSSRLHVQSQQEPFLHPEEESWTQYRNLRNRKIRMEQVPILLDLKQHQHVGIYGDYTTCVTYLMNKILQFILLHEPSSYRLCLILPSHLAIAYGIKQLPQLFYASTRLLIVKVEDGKQVNTVLHRLLKDTTRCLLICSFSKQLETRLDMEEFLSNPQVHYLLIAQHIQELRAQCKAIIELQHHGIYEKQEFTMEQSDQYHMATSLFQYYGYEQVEVLEGFPKQFSFLDLYQCGNVEQLQIQTRWNKTDTTGLEALIGIDEHGIPVCLDAHELYHGPHGLVAGMTGSGKSEWLLTYLLSLAVSFSPEDVQFILIDYKGGGMAQAFQTLPHVAGVITNLEQESIQRCIVGIQQELTRRQQLFLQVRESCQKTVMHIDQYCQLYKEGYVTESMSHLMIVADEFAELKQQQPAFMEDLKRIARIGRSLGIHLLLATQKPSGIVDEQIWSNARFHVCLKVQDTMDSVDMLKKDDAVHINETGVFYLQVGHDEWYGKGLCAWANAPYQPKEDYEVYRNQQISVISTTAQPLFEQAEQKKKAPSITQLEAIVPIIEQAATQLQTHAKPLWLNPLEEALDTEQLSNEYHLTDIIGIGDDILHRKRIPIRMEEGASYAFIADRESDIQLIMNALLIHHQCYEHTVLFTNKVMQERLSSCFDDVIDVVDLERIQSFFYQAKYPRKTLTILYPAEVFFKDAFLEQFFVLFEKLDHTICLLYHSPTAITNRIQQFLHRIYCFSIKDMSSYHYLIQGSIPAPTKIIGRGFVYLEQQIIPMQIAKGYLNKRNTTWKIPILPDRIILQVKKNHLFLGIQEDSKEAIWWDQRSKQDLFILYQYAIPAGFERVLRKQVEHKMKNLFCMSILEYKQQRSILEQKLNAGAMLWVGSGLEDHLYLLKLPYGGQYVLKDNQGLLWKGETCQFIRLAEVIENG